MSLRSVLMCLGFLLVSAVEGELHREFTPADSDRSVRVAEIYATSILALDRSEKQPSDTSGAELGDKPAD